MSRTVRWKYNDNGGFPYWTASASSNNWLKHNVELSFVVQSGRRSSLVNQNARLIVKKKTKVNGKTVATILVTKEFSTSYWAKEIVDNLLTIASQLFRNQEDAEAFLINTLKNGQNAEIPEPNLKNYIIDGGRGWYC
jgi:hypothetical protein